MQGVTTDALRSLEVALDAPRRSGVALGNWRWAVRQRLVEVREALVSESMSTDESWLAARGGAALRERSALLTRLRSFGQAVLDTPDPELVRRDVRRLVVDVSHHVQRVHDLAYDSVEVEFGGEN